MSDDDGNWVRPRTKRRGGPPTMPGAGDDHKVGYKKPPLHSRFKPGQPSANPRGRPKGSSRVDPITKILNQKVTITRGGRVVSVRLSEALTRVAVKKAMDGDRYYHNMIIKAQHDLAKLEAERAPTRKELLAEIKENKDQDEIQKRL